MKEILIEYVIYLKNNLINFLNLNYLVPLIILFLIFNIIVSYTIDQIYKNMKKETSIVLLILLINIY